ncbi:MAG TPA: T9SS type A sorting domain-containing protein, partial [Bacteroidales bacterium]|nr:T9SS type A sorting domain-containing protein [Bacteroidales bacterium]
ITMHFNAFDITPRDYVRVTDLEDNTLIAELTGSVIPDDIICNSGQILVQLKTFDKVMAQGFSISYYNSSNLNEIPHTEFSVSPNPAKDLLTLTFQNGQQEEYALKIFSVEGRLLFEKAFRLSPGQQNQVIDVSMLQPGFYLLHIASGNVNSTKKIIIE